MDLLSLRELQVVVEVSSPDRQISRYFLSQNAAIAAGKITGITLNLKVLGVGDGLTVTLCTVSLNKSFDLF